MAKTIKVTYLDDTIVLSYKFQTKDGREAVFKYISPGENPKFVFEVEKLLYWYEREGYIIGYDEMWDLEVILNE